MILWKLEGLPGYIISMHDINITRYADDTLLMADIQERLNEISEEVVEKAL